MPDLLLRGGHVWRHDGPADVLIEDGTIAAMGARSRRAPPTSST